MKIDLDLIGKILAVVVWGAAGIGQDLTATETGGGHALALGLALYVAGGVLNGAIAALRGKGK